MLIEDIEYVMFRHPDMATVRDFMVDYGLLDLQQGGNALYMRSYGDAPFSYVAMEGDAAFVGFGFRVTSREALDQLAADHAARSRNQNVHDVSNFAVSEGDNTEVSHPANSMLHRVIR